MFKFLYWLVTFIVCGALGVTAWGGHVEPQVMRALPSLASMLLPITAVVAVLWGAVMLITWRWKAALFTAVVIALCWSAIRTVIPIHPIAHMQVSRKAHVDSRNSDNSGDRLLRVVTLNVMNWGWYDGTQRQPNPNMLYILDEQADIVVLVEAAIVKDFMELPSMDSLREQINALYPYRSTRKNRSDGDIMLLSRYPIAEVDCDLTTLTDNAIKRHRHNIGRAWDVNVEGDTIRVIGVHLQSFGLTDDDKDAIDRSIAERQRPSMSDSHSMIGKLRSAVTKHASEAQDIARVVNASGENVIVAGDFNDTPCSYAYHLLRDTGLDDAWADAGLGYRATFNRNHLLFKIDHILYRGRLQAVRSDVTRRGESDHYPLAATLRLSSKQ